MTMAEQFIEIWNASPYRNRSVARIAMVIDPELTTRYQLTSRLLQFSDNSAVRVSGKGRRFALTIETPPKEHTQNDHQ